MKERREVFEDDMAKLERIVEELGSGELSLGQSLNKYEEGMKLAKKCTILLNEAQRKVELLMKKDGTVTAEPFDEQEEDQ